MEVTRAKWTTPKSKPAALNQVVCAMLQIENIDTKGAKIMDSLEQAQAKMHRIQETIDQLQKQLTFGNEGKEKMLKRIEELKSAYTLTEAEILEHKSKLLREQISRLQLSAETQTQITEDKI